MTVLMWIAVLVAAWFVASVALALVLGRYLRCCAADAADAGGAGDARRTLDTGPLRLWLADLPDSRELIRSGPRVPAPRAADESSQVDVETTAVR